MKRVFVYFGMLALAGILALANFYLLHLQTEKQEHISNLQAQVNRHLRENKFLNDRNDALRVEVDNLRSPDSYFSYEEKARENYGLIGANETFFVLPQAAIKHIPDIEGLIDEKSLTSLTNAPSFDDLENMRAIPVSPIPLQLESIK